MRALALPALSVFGSLMAELLSLFVFFFAAVRPLSMSHSFDLSGKKKSTFTPDVVVWFL